jgi:hypothetical protein
MMRRIAKIGGACAAAVVLLAGCGGEPFSSAVGPGGAPRSGAARLLSAVAHVSDAKTARLAMNMRVEGLGDAGAVTLTGSGVMDFRKERAAITMRVLAGGHTESAELRVVDGVVWTNDGSGWRNEPVGDAKTTGAFTSDPTSFLTYLRGVANDVHEDGHDVVRGVDTTKYSAKVDLRRAIEQSEDAEARARAQAALGLVGDLELPVNVWIDEQDRVRKFEVEMDLTEAFSKFGDLGMKSDLHPRISAIIEFYDFGVPVDVKAP